VPSCSSSSSLPSGPIRGSSQNAFSMLLHHAGHKPALVAAGSRRSGRVIKPSEKLRQSESTPVATLRKRSADTSAQSQPTRRRRIAAAHVGASDTDVVSTSGHVSDPASDGGTEADTDAAYQQTKALGDADRVVSHRYLAYSQCSLLVLAGTKGSQGRTDCRCPPDLQAGSSIR
jgi:hypothetical protein